MDTTTAALHLLRTRLDEAGFQVRVGTPDTDAALTLWPWQLAESAVLRGGAPGFGGGPTAGPAAPAFELRLLLVAPDTADAVSLLTRAHAVLSASPVVPVGEVTCHLHATTLTTTELAALFTAAGRPLRLSSAFVLRPGR